MKICPIINKSVTYLMIGIGIKTMKTIKVKELMASWMLLNKISIGELSVTIVLENKVLYLYSHKGINQ